MSHGTLFSVFVQIVRWVSWNEFVYHMLAKGEVEEIIVRPDSEIVTIILHDGAVVKGRKVSSTTSSQNGVAMMKRYCHSCHLCVFGYFRWSTRPIT